MILVTGATGFVGRSLMAWLEREGIAARAYEGRMNNPLQLRQELEGITTVVHLASSEARGRNRLLNHVDVDGSERLVEEAKRANVRRIIFVSRLGADPDSMHPLLRAKGQVERIIQRSGIDYTILRTASLYGRNDRYFELIVGLAIWSWPIVWLPGGGQICNQPLWVEDFVRCLVKSLSRSTLINKTITIAGGEQLPYAALVQQLLAVAGYHRFPLPIPMLIFRPLTPMLFNWWYWPAVSRYFMDRFFVPEVTEHDAVYRQFGFQPARIRDTISYLRRPGLALRIFRR
ncbi:MAG: NAD(P)H-binding protein [Ardenticatenaceae bacterium]|nr:NAD(P)H-binding protein [Anaerolineales bacterium]MCB8938289.1 NAD(P)H-binding protein [Ardenticatenaceae bacterium]MCB8975654.1 NAD(P)H-binding protein [Ardenticatenaceae bacterium]